MTKHACLARPSAFTTNRAVELHSLQRIPPSETTNTFNIDFKVSNSVGKNK